MADGLQTFALNEKPANTKMNKVSRRVIIDVASEANLPPSPYDGMHCFILDTEDLVYWNGSGWLYYPRGIMGSVVGSTGTGTAGSHPYGITGSTVLVNGSGCTVDVLAGHKYRYSGNLAMKCDNSDTQFVFNVQYDGTNMTNEDRYVSCDVTDRVYHLSWQTIFTPLVDDNVVVRMVVARFSGPGNGAVLAGKDIILEHLGHIR